MSETLTPRERARRLIAAVAARYKLSLRDIIGSGRSRKEVKARHDAVRAVAAEFPAWGLMQLGRIFERDHSTILYVLGGKHNTRHSWSLPSRPSIYRTERTCLKCGMMWITRHDAGPGRIPWAEWFDRDGRQIFMSRGSPPCEPIPLDARAQESSHANHANALTLDAKQAPTSRSQPGLSQKA